MCLVKHFEAIYDSTIHMRQLMRLWYFSHKRPAKAQASLRIRVVSSERMLIAHMKYGRRQSVQPKIRHLAPLNGCACAFEELSLRRTKSAIISRDGSNYVCMTDAGMMHYQISQKVPNFSQIDHSGGELVHDWVRVGCVRVCLLVYIKLWFF